MRRNKTIKFFFILITCVSCENSSKVKYDGGTEHVKGKNSRLEILDTLKELVGEEKLKKMIQEIEKNEAQSEELIKTKNSSSEDN